MSNALQRDQNLDPNNFVYILKHIEKQSRKINKLKMEKKVLTERLSRCTCSIFPTHQFEEDSFVCKKVVLYTS